MSKETPPGFTIKDKIFTKLIEWQLRFQAYLDEEIKKGPPKFPELQEPKEKPVGTRAELVQAIEEQKKTDPELKYAETDHFIVIQRGGSKNFKKYDSFLDTDPMSLAIFLENGLEKISETFDLPKEIATHVVTVRNRGLKLSDWVIAGIHTKNESSDFKEHTWQGIEFVTVMSDIKPDYASGNYPALYKYSGHEVLGHGYFQPKINSRLMPEIADLTRYREEEFVAVLNEGTSQYTGQILTGENSHREFAGWLLSTAEFLWFPIPSVSESIDMQFRKSQIETKIHNQKLSLSAISLPETFTINDTTEFKLSEAGMQRGASFIKYLVDEYGIEVYKQWVSKADRSNYISMLEDLTSSSLEEMQEEWRAIVLEQMRQVLDREHQEHKHSKPRLARRDSIVELFENYT